MLLSVVVKDETVIEKLKKVPGVLEVHVESAEDEDEEEESDAEDVD